MANKETKKERRDSARRARQEAQRRAAARKNRNRIIGMIVALAAVGGIVVAVVLNAGKDAELVASLNEAAPAAGCTELQEHADEGAQHVETDPEYGTNPPTSGDHFARWERTGVHLAPIANGNQVHNLEHGHVGIQYREGEISDELLAGLEEVTNEDDTAVFMAPKPDLEQPLAFSAWARSSVCAEPGDVESVVAFARLWVDTQARKGPEGSGFNPGTPTGGFMDQ